MIKNIQMNYVIIYYEKFKYVKYLNAKCNEKITDDGIKHFDLQALNIYRNCKITDNGIKHMNLKVLDASMSNITNNGIKLMYLYTLKAILNPYIT